MQHSLIRSWATQKSNVFCAPTVLSIWLGRRTGSSSIRTSTRGRTPSTWVSRQDARLQREPTLDTSQYREELLIDFPSLAKDYPENGLMLESIYNVDMNCRVIDTGMLDCTQRFGKAATRIWYLLHSVGVITAPKLPENSLLVIMSHWMA